MSGVRVGNAWKTASNASVRVGGAWKTVSTVSVRVGGAWKVSTLGTAPPPIITYVSTGVFEVANTDLTGVYTTTLLTGSGTANQSTFNNKRRFSLTSENARFSVTFSYAAGAPQSSPGFMERLAYTYSCRLGAPYSCNCGPCNCRTEGGNCFCVAPDANGCPPGTSPNGQCGCGSTFPNLPCMGGSIGTFVCDTCCGTCQDQICDVLIDQPGYINSTTEWYKVT
jgi:hypothetical protein